MADPVVHRWERANRWECDGDSGSEAWLDQDSNSSDDETEVKSPLDDFLEYMNDLDQERNLNAKQLCIAMHLCGKAYNCPEAQRAPLKRFRPTPPPTPTPTIPPTSATALSGPRGRGMWQ